MGRLAKFYAEGNSMSGAALDNERFVMIVKLRTIADEVGGSKGTQIRGLAEDLDDLIRIILYEPEITGE